MHISRTPERALDPLTSGDDTIAGSSGVDLIEGGTGDDMLIGEGGYDAIHGGDGNDFIVGDVNFTSIDDLLGHLEQNPGSLKYGDWITGGAGDDTIASGLWSEEPYLNVGLGNPYQQYWEHLDGAVFSQSADSIWGGAGDDSIKGGGAGAIFGGGSGNDSLAIVDGDDHQVFGGPGNDFLSNYYGDGLMFGGDGNDTIQSGEGNDTIWGGTGDDLMQGGQSISRGVGYPDNFDDIFMFGDGHGNDTLEYFDQENDIIDLSHLSDRFASIAAVEAVSEIVAAEEFAPYDFAILIHTGDTSSILVGLNDGQSFSDLLLNL